MDQCVLLSLCFYFLLLFFLRETRKLLAFCLCPVAVWNVRFSFIANLLYYPEKDRVSLDESFFATVWIAFCFVSLVWECFCCKTVKERRKGNALKETSSFFTYFLEYRFREPQFSLCTRLCLRGKTEDKK